MGSKHDEKARPLSPEKGSLSVWTPERVKAGLAKRDQTMAQLSRDNGFHEDYVRQALQRPMFVAEQIIAAALGVKARVIWPDRYASTGVGEYREHEHARRAKALALRTKNRSAA